MEHGTEQGTKRRKPGEAAQGTQKKTGEGTRPGALALLCADHRLHRGAVPGNDHLDPDGGPDERIHP